MEGLEGQEAHNGSEVSSCRSDKADDGELNGENADLT